MLNNFKTKFIFDLTAERIRRKSGFPLTSSISYQSAETDMQETYHNKQRKKHKF